VLWWYLVGVEEARQEGEQQEREKEKQHQSEAREEQRLV
jgi:hypothetical protein